ncbi:hypothetical protein J4444_01650 [Candidatus Woesearchaeota archaeon]|nr:hypothetical protein [Candidatus Woesearchaeota archaeon]
MKPIKITSQEKITTIRLRESAKKELESMGHVGQTHEEILLGIIRLLKNSKSETKIIEKGNMTGTKYARQSKTFQVEIDHEKYAIVCAFNDLGPMPFRKTEWEIDLEIVNVSPPHDNKWRALDTINTKTAQLLYFVAIKQVLEESFNLKIYELSTTEDFLSYDKWKSVYSSNKLSMESFQSDIERNLRHAT